MEPGKRPMQKVRKQTQSAPNLSVNGARAELEFVSVHRRSQSPKR